jgi:molybdopterin converting factor small subunit
MEKPDTQVNMMIHVLFFSYLKERTGINEYSLLLPRGSRIIDLEEILTKQFPRLNFGYPKILVAINRNFASLDEIIPQDADVAFFPPVSGG